MKFIKLTILFFVSLTLFIAAKEVNAAVIHRAPNNLGLVGYWSFNDATSTKATDFSGNKNTGTLTGASGLPVWTGGKLGSALSFDGVDDYVKISDSVSLHLTNLTLSLWFKVNQWPVTEVEFLAKSDDWTTMDWYLAYGYSAGEMDFIVGEQNGAKVFGNLSYSPTTGIWHHLVITKSGNTYKLYDNNSYIGQDTSAQTWNDTDKLYIGANYGGSEDYFNGTIDEVRVYNRALSASEIGRLYRAGKHQ